jgi:hypothetical protein
MPSTTDTELATNRVFAQWTQTFITDDGIFARHDSTLSILEQPSEIRISADNDDATRVLIGETHRRGYRKTVADKFAVLPMLAALQSGVLPYRFVLPNNDVALELRRAMLNDDVHTENPEWGPQVTVVEDGVATRVRSIHDGPDMFVIAEIGNAAPAVYTGPRDHSSIGALMHYDERLVRLI